MRGNPVVNEILFACRSLGFGQNKTSVTIRQVFDAFGEVIARGGH